ncbi:MAG: HAD-IIIA family hydrolase [Candidatus Omnitrophica bacterium]|nr:HAD-IIIA family hydrolase [Candidatus Omnitrophota bacterium]
MGSIPAIFLDKDGTLIRDVPNNTDIRHIELTPHAMQGLRKLDKAGFRFFIITNQRGIADGLFTESDLTRVKDFLEQIFADNDLKLSGFYYCPHHPKAAVEQFREVCDCRKPGPGLIRQAVKDHELDVARSWLIGDILDDIECGRRAGCRTILMDTGNETEWHWTELRRPHYKVKNILEAARLIADPI